MVTHITSNSLNLNCSEDFYNLTQAWSTLILLYSELTTLLHCQVVYTSNLLSCTVSSNCLQACRCVVSRAFFFFFFFFFFFYSSIYNAVPYRSPRAYVQANTVFYGCMSPDPPPECCASCRGNCRPKTAR